MTKTEKELFAFVVSLNNRGLLSMSTDEFDYEWVIWDYLHSLPQSITKHHSQNKPCNKVPE